MAASLGRSSGPAAPALLDKAAHHDTQRTPLSGSLPSPVFLLLRKVTVKANPAGARGLIDGA